MRLKRIRVFIEAYKEAVNSLFAEQRAVLDRAFANLKMFTK